MSAVAAGLAFAAIEPPACRAQSGAVDGASGVAAPTPAMPGTASPTGIQPPTGIRQPAGRQAVPAMPALPSMTISPEFTGGVIPEARSRGDNRIPAPGFPSPIPRREVPGPAPAPQPAIAGLPALAHDHHGDGAGTVGSSLIWMGQLPQRDGPYEDGAGKVGGPIFHVGRLSTVVPPSHAVLTQGTLSYGPPGLHPGFYGFGLSYHPGYGYGGNGLGVGTCGGNPFYGGPGYPSEYGYPKFACPYYEGIGQLYFDPPVVATDFENPGDFGPYTGASDYAYTHPTYTAEAAATGSSIPGERRFPDTSATNSGPEATFTPGEGGAAAANRVPAQDRHLGMDIEPAASADGRLGMKIVNVLPESTAARAGFNPGDLIFSANGYATDRRGDLGWIISNAAPDRKLRLSVRKAIENRDQTVTLDMP
ncbi:MAG: PDZ domain-containing protein [Isosphaeraceae bacterium]